MKYLLAFASVLLCFLTFEGAAAQSNSTFIDVYGSRKVTREQIDEVLQLEYNSPDGVSRDEIKKRIGSISGVEEVAVSPVQYPGTTVVFIGIHETGAPKREYRAVPNGEIELDSNLLERYEAVMAQLLPAIKAGQAGEDRSAGHAISEYGPMKEKQMKLPAIADEKFEHLATVIRDSSDQASRAAAANIIAYAKDKKAVIEVLRTACDDPDSLVRNNAVRALAVIAEYADENPELKLDIDHTPFLGLLGSFVWTDRNKGAAVVDALTRNRSAELLDQLREKYLVELSEMARWKSGGHAFFSIRILARVAGFSENEISRRSQEAKTHEQRLEWVEQIVNRIKKEKTEPQ